MKNLNKSKYLIFMSKTNIAFVALNIFNNETNVLFADQVEVNENDIQSNLSNLLTNAANFLGFNIKHADLIFEDYDISVKLINKQFNNCNTKDDVIKAIYKEANINSLFVNNIIFNPISFANNKANVICKTLVTKYSNYEYFTNLVKYNNVQIDSCINIATLLNNVEDSLVLNVTGDKLYACQYLQNNLVNCFDLNVNFKAIIEKLAVKFNTTFVNINKLLNITNYIINNDDLSFDLSWNYDLKNRKLETIKAFDFINAWREELQNQINDCFTINNWKNTLIITSNKINNLNNSDIENNIIGLDNLSADKIQCVLNVNRIKDIENQSKFDAKLEKSFAKIVA